jgi:deoxyribonuclease V
MIGAFDVHYSEDSRASAAAVLFAGYSQAGPSAEYTHQLPRSFPYVPGELYKRELPSILALIARIREPLREAIVDGYVMLGDRPGLGQHLYLALRRRIPVIGVAKSPFGNARAVRVYRGRSERPLFVTSAGIDPQEAADRIEWMHGPHRIPTLLRRVDRLARGQPG